MQADPLHCSCIRVPPNSRNHHGDGITLNRPELHLQLYDRSIDLYYHWRNLFNPIKAEDDRPRSSFIQSYQHRCWDSQPSNAL
jgi:hypothetical protein